MIINHLRTYEKSCTVADVYVDGKYFGDTLEDVGRPTGVKVYAETCIPEGVYKVTISYSNRFKQPMMLLYNQDDFSIENGGVRFTGIRVHGGTNVEHTAGCPLLLGYEALQAQVAVVLDADGDVFWVISGHLGV